MLHHLPPHVLVHVLEYSQTNVQTGYKGSMKGGGITNIVFVRHKNQTQRMKSLEIMEFSC